MRFGLFQYSPTFFGGDAVAGLGIRHSQCHPKLCWFGKAGRPRCLEGLSRTRASSFPFPRGGCGRPMGFLASVAAE